MEHPASLLIIPTCRNGLRRCLPVDGKNPHRRLRLSMTMDRKSLAVLALIASGVGGSCRDTGPAVTAVVRFDSGTSTVASLGDVDGDGLTEFLAANPDNDVGGLGAGSVRALSGLGLRVLWEIHGEAGERVGARMKCVGDVDGDGIPDWITGTCSADPGLGALQVRSGANGALLRAIAAARGKSALPSLPPPAPLFQVVSDADGDGLPDVLVRQPAPGTWTPPPNASGAARESLDEIRHDILSVVTGRVLLELPAVWVFLGTVSDLNGDGCLDLLVRQRDGEHHVLSGRDATSLALLDVNWRMRCGQGGTPVHLLSGVALGDVDGDGIGDFATVQTDTALWIVSGRTTAITAAFPAEQIFSGFGNELEPLGDLDGDGAAELMVSTPSHDDHGTMRNYGHVAVVSGRTGLELRSFQGDIKERHLGGTIASLGDLDGDGLTEVGVSASYRHASEWGSVVRIYRGRHLR